MKNDFKRAASLFTAFKEIGLDPNIISQAYIVNNSNDHPYHNFQHLLTVALRAVEGGQYYNLELEQIQSLAIAGLSHDAMYVIGETEEVNIGEAVKFSRFLCQENSVKESIVKIVERLIRSTEFPHHEVSELSEKIIQDADLMQSLEEDCEKFLNGLCIEKNDPQIADPRFPGIDGFNTIWAKQVYSKKFFSQKV